MAEKASKNQKVEQKQALTKSPGFRVGLVISALVLILTSATILVLTVNRSLFSKNPHFTIQHVTVSNSTFWRSRVDDLMTLLDIKIGQTNLFQFELADIVRKLQKEPGIERAYAARVLPDTLKLEISERIPRAYIRSSSSGWVVDSNSILMEAVRTAPAKGALPVITGLRLKKPVPAGSPIPEISEAMKVIMEAITKYPDIKINTINLGIPEEMHIYFNHKNYEDELLAYFPAKYSDDKLVALNIFFTMHPGEDLVGKYLDLRFKDMVIQSTLKLPDEKTPQKSK